MYKFIATLLLLTNVNAFTAPSTRSVLTSAVQVPTTTSQSFESHTSSSTALGLKVKVDPDAKGNNNAAGNAKMAAYGGSILIAIALPFVFLIWSAVKN
ncbi:hypothetical protein ACHAWO_009782 [Cyclotella atomus]|jgi:hypothetical protein|uniref:Uncharacterized protein n=1 Tax=Cyclotella atomus TaxID=382360 RepID=A0ABD3NAM6_9STRA